MRTSDSTFKVGDQRIGTWRKDASGKVQAPDINWPTLQAERHEASLQQDIANELPNILQREQLRLDLIWHLLRCPPDEACPP